MRYMLHIKSYLINPTLLSILFNITLNLNLILLLICRVIASIHHEFLGA